MSEKILSIIVPAYNMEVYLPKCLGSLIVAPELMEKLEVLVVNDGSKDRTSEIAHEFAAKWPRTFEVIDKENGHYGSCINAALPLAKGRYVRILDADDYVKTDGLRDFLTTIENVTVDVIVARHVSVNPNGDVIWQPERECLPPCEIVSINQLKDVCFLSQHAISYNRKLFEGDWYRQLEGIQYTDCQWCSEPMLRVSTMYYVPHVVTCYLIGRDGQSIDHSVRLKSIKQQMRVDLRLAHVYASGRTAGVEDGAWEYFKRIYFSELSVVYSLGTVGNEAGRIPRKDLTEFDQELKRVDPMGYVEVMECNSAKITFGRIFTFRFIKSFRNETGFMLSMKYYLCKAYVCGRRAIGKWFSMMG